MNSIALRFESRTWSWPAVDEAVAGWARWLESQGLQRAEQVVVTSWNRPEMLFLFLGAARLGASFIALNARLTEFERQALIARLKPRVLLTHSFPDVTGVADAPWSLHDARREATAAALFTSGTTGAPKLVELTHSQFVANATATAANLSSAASDGWLGTLPLFHIGGLAMAYRWAWQRSRLVLEGQFDATRASRWLESGEVTHASLVPTTLERVLEANAGRGFSHHVRAVLVGGGPMSLPLMQRAKAMGLPVLQTYGLTEACSGVTSERPSEADGATAGPPLPGIEVRIVDDEIQVRGPTVTGAPGRWLATGDLGSLDARGRLTVWSRRVDLIVTGGENVYPAEVEQVLAAHPAIAEVVVVPRADATWGQVPVAVVVWRGEPEPVLEWARARLAGFKLPFDVVSVDTVPRNANGKVERRVLIDRVNTCRG